MWSVWSLRLGQPCPCCVGPSRAGPGLLGQDVRYLPSPNQERRRSSARVRMICEGLRPLFSGPQSVSLARRQNPRCEPNRGLPNPCNCSTQQHQESHARRISPRKIGWRASCVLPGSQVVRQRILIPPYAGSTPARATSYPPVDDVCRCGERSTTVGVSCS